MSIENKIVDLGNHPEFKSSHLRQKNLLLIPSQGEANTNILVGIEGEMLYEHRQAGQVTSENAGIFVSRIPLPKAEAAYRAQVFGEMNPKWLVPTQGKSGVPLDQIILADEKFLDQIALSVQNRFGSDKPSLYGFNETPEMQQIADKLGIAYYGNSNFANWAGTKIGLQEFCKENGVATPLTFPIYEKTEIFKIAKDFKDAGYDEVVVKVSHSTGGMGHLRVILDDIPELLSQGGIDKLFPEEYLENEGGVVQGWVPESISASIATFVDFDGTYVFEGAQAHVIDKGDKAFGAIGATPITQDFLNPMLEVGRKLAKGYVKHNAWGSHTMGMLFVPPEVSKKLGLPAGVPLCNDENARCGASTISKAWILALREGRYGIGWIVSKIHVDHGTKIDKVIAKLDQNGLLIKKPSHNANGIFVFNGSVLDSGYEDKFYAIAISGKDDPQEAKDIMKKAYSLFN